MPNIFKTMQSLFTRKSRQVAPPATLPNIKRTAAVAIRAVAKRELDDYAIKTGGNSLKFQTTVSNAACTQRLLLASLFEQKDLRRLVFVENVEHVGATAKPRGVLQAGFAGTQVGVTVGMHCRSTGIQHSFAWVLPDKAVRFA